VEAPLGTEARALMPARVVTSASTVRLPRESRISREVICAIFINLFWLNVSGKKFFDENCNIHTKYVSLFRKVKYRNYGSIQS
jgi:hypothetical protein